MLFEAQGTPRNFGSAGFGMRTLALFVDLPLIVITYTVVSFLLLDIFADSFALSVWLTPGPKLGELVAAWFGGSQAALPLLVSASQVVAVKALMVFGIALLYYTSFEMIAGGTPGKLMLGLSVIECETRLTPGFLKAIARNSAKILSLLTLGLGALLALVTVEKQSLHDLLSGCAVTRSGPPSVIRAAVAVVLIAVLAILGTLTESVSKANLRARLSTIRIVYKMKNEGGLPSARAALVGAAESQLASVSAAGGASQSYAENDDVKLFLKHCLGFFDAENHRLTLYLFSDSRQPRETTDLRSFLERADVVLALTFSRSARVLNQDSLSSYVVSFRKQPGGFKLARQRKSMEFTRLRMGAPVIQGVTLSSPIALGDYLNISVKDEGRWIREHETQRFRWRVEVTTPLLDGKLLRRGVAPRVREEG